MRMDIQAQPKVSAQEGTQKTLTEHRTQTNNVQIRTKPMIWEREKTAHCTFVYHVTDIHKNEKYIFILSIKRTSTITSLIYPLNKHKLFRCGD